MIPLEDMPLLLLCSVRVAPRTLFYAKTKSPCATPRPALHRSPFTVHRSPFTSSPCYTAPCATPLTVHRSPRHRATPRPALHRSPFTVHRVTVLHRALRYTAHRSPFTASPCYTSSPCYTAPLRYTAHRSPSTVHCVTVLHRALRKLPRRSCRHRSHRCQMARTKAGVDITQA